jgi:hypothetical protein
MFGADRSLSAEPAGPDFSETMRATSGNRRTPNRSRAWEYCGSDSLWGPKRPALKAQQPFCSSFGCGDRWTDRSPGAVSDQTLTPRPVLEGLEIVMGRDGAGDVESRRKGFDPGTMSRGGAEFSDEPTA